ncbi:hypothetical protein ACIA49_03985 [Kribbella sp. NPDC051587]|uniref:DUF6414 family protein n=1 Tax=Kribbella sp. NPDC051587 TaxID=3364119 RepID=UPI00378B89F0
MKWLKKQLGRPRIWWRNRRRRKKPTPQALEAAFREFVYLDEVSVVSLLSARLGQVPSEFTQSVSNTSKVEITSGVDADAGVVKSKVGSRFESSQAQDTKVVSRATIQTGFRNLYAKAVEDGSLALGPISGHSAPIAPVDAAAILAAGVRSASQDLTWLAPVNDLHRGDLMEVEVELQADSVFHFSTVLSILSELFGESDQILSQIDKKSFDQVLEVNGMLDKLLVGLVPIKCLIADYFLANAETESPLIVNRKTIEAIPEVSRPDSRQVHLVAVLEKELFWKDLRRVLFAGSRFRVLCRLSSEGVADSWNPVKLAEVLREVAPELGGIVESFGDNAIGFMKEYTKSQKGALEPRVNALIDYSELVANYQSLSLNEAQKAHVSELASAHADQLTSVPESRKGFLAVSQYMAEISGKSLMPKDAAELRQQAQELNGLHPGGSLVSRASAAIKPASKGDGANLHAEVIAIYW